MAAARFQPGDRVRARVSTALVQAGMPGTIVQAYGIMHDAYDVRFDGQSTPILMWADALEPADRPADDTP